MALYNASTGLSPSERTSRYMQRMSSGDCIRSSTDDVPKGYSKMLSTVSKPLLISLEVPTNTVAWQAARSDEICFRAGAAELIRPVRPWPDHFSECVLSPVDYWRLLPV